MSPLIPILLYHSVAENTTTRYRRWAIHPGIFAAHLAYLHDCGYTPITVTHLAVVTAFAYPHGYYDPGVRRLVRQAGYTSARAVKHATSTLLVKATWPG